MPDEGEIRTIDLPGGRKLDQRWREWDAADPATGELTHYAQWVDIGSPYNQQRERQGPSDNTVRNTAADNARADAKFQYEKDRNALLDEERRLKAERDRADDDLDRAIKLNDVATATEIRRENRARQDRIDGINDEQRAIDNDYRERTFAISQGKADLEKKQYEDDLANKPGNYFNYSFRSRGMEPPPNPGELSGAKASDRPWYENYSLERLERFPDEELVKLPPEILSKFRNEFLLKRPALLAMLSPERIRGEGQFKGTGFADEVISTFGKGAPAPPQPKVQPPTSTGTHGQDFSGLTPPTPAAVQPPQNAGMGTNGVVASNNLFPTAGTAVEAPQGDPRVLEAIRMAEAAKKGVAA